MNNITEEQALELGYKIHNDLHDINNLLFKIILTSNCLLVDEFNKQNIEYLNEIADYANTLRTKFNSTKCFTYKKQ